MTAFLVFTDFEPLLVMAPRTAAVDGRLVRGLGEKVEAGSIERRIFKALHCK